LYGLTGPLGKGLGLMPSSNGIHMVFAAGTGVLPFMDMVAKLLRQELGALAPADERFHPDFKLVMFVGSQSRKDAIALPLLEGLQDLVNRKGTPDKFRLYFRFSDQKSPRWDKNFIQDNLETYQPEGISKIWVCGPPLMQELFDKALNSLAPVYGLDLRTQVDIM